MIRLQSIVAVAFLVTSGVRRLFDLLRDDVMEATGRKQQPFASLGAGRQEFYFAVKP